MSDFNICQYWYDEPVVCGYWDVDAVKCTYEEEDDDGNIIRGDYYPYCNLLGTSANCSKYDGSGTKFRCVLPDPRRHVCNRKTGKKWVYPRLQEDIDSNTGEIIRLASDWSFDEITCYGDDGQCNGCEGGGEGKSPKCSGYSPYHMSYGALQPSDSSLFDSKGFSTIDEIGVRVPLTHVIYNRRALLSKCYWWKGDVSEFTVDENGSICTVINSYCQCTDGKSDYYKSIIDDSGDVPLASHVNYDEELGIYIPPCNGAKPECPCYTGVRWKYCLDKYMRLGDKVLAEQILEIRYYLKGNSWDEDEYKEYFIEPDIYTVDETDDGEKDMEILYDSNGKVNVNINATRVYIDSFDIFDLKKESVRLTTGTSDSYGKSNKYTLIRNLNDLGTINPVIRNVFEQHLNENIFEVTSLKHKYVLIFGDVHYDTVYGVNLSDPSLLLSSYYTNYLLENNSIFEIRQVLSREKFEEFHSALDCMLTNYFLYYEDKVIAPESGVDENSFFINMPTFFGDNEVFVFCKKEGGYWEYDKIKFKKVFCGGVIQQYMFSIDADSSDSTLGYLPMYESGFMASENDNGLINFHFNSFNSELLYVYNDFVIDSMAVCEHWNDSLDKCTDGDVEEYGSEEKVDVDVGYKFFKVDYLINYIADVSDGTLKFFGNAGYAFVVINDSKKMLSSYLRPWIIDDEYDDSNVELEVDTVDNQGERYSISYEIVEKCTDRLEVNHIIIKPKEISCDKFRGIDSNEATLCIKKISHFEKRTYKTSFFNDEPTDYINSGWEEIKDPSISERYGSYCKCRFLNKAELTSQGKGNEGDFNLRKFDDEILLMSVVFKSRYTGRVRGVVRTKMVTWVRQPYSRDVELSYKWRAEYETKKLRPSQYYRLNDIGEDPGDNTVYWYTPPSVNYVLYPYTDFPINAYYYITYLVRECTRIEELPIEYFDIFKDTNINHGFFDMRYLGPPKRVPGIYYILPDDVGGYLSGCFTRYYRLNATKLYGPEGNIFEGKGRYRGGLDYLSKEVFSINNTSAVGTCLNCYNTCVYTWLGPRRRPVAYCIGCQQERLDQYDRFSSGGDEYYSLCTEESKRYVMVGEGEPDRVYLDLSSSCTYTCPVCGGEVGPDFHDGNLTHIDRPHPLKFGNAIREFLRSFRSIDNLYYGKSGAIWTDPYPEVAIDRAISNELTDDRALKEMRSKNDIKYYYKKWMPCYYGYSYVDFTEGLNDYMCNMYTVDLSSPFSHPLGLFMCSDSDVEGFSIEEEFVVFPGSVEAGVTEYLRFKFDELFDVNSLDDEILYDNDYDLVYPEAITASGVSVLSNRIRNDENCDLRNKFWLTYKEELPYDALEEGESVQWAWKELWRDVERNVDTDDYKFDESRLMDCDDDTGVDVCDNSVFSSRPYQGTEELFGLHKFLSILYPNYKFDSTLTEHQLVCDEGDHVIRFIPPTREDDGSYTAPVFFIQLDDGPPRSFDLSGSWDSTYMLLISTSVGGYETSELLEIYLTCTEYPWISDITLFSTDYDNIDIDAAESDGRCFNDCPLMYHQRGLNVVLNTDCFDYFPKKYSIIESSYLEFAFNNPPNCFEDGKENDWASVEPYQTYPSNGYCFYVDYCCYGSFELFVDLKQKKSISRIVCSFSFGKYNFSRIDEETGESTDILYHIPSVEVWRVDSIEESASGYKIGTIASSMYLSDESFTSFEEKVYSIDFNLDPSELLYPASRYLKLVFRLQPTVDEINDVFDKYNDYLKYINKVRLNCVYIYECEFVEAIENIKTYEQKYYITKGAHGDFGLTKLHVMDDERDEVRNKGEYNIKNRKVDNVVSTVYQIDCFDGVVGQDGSNGSHTSINKCRGRLMTPIYSNKDKAYLDGYNIDTWENLQESYFNIAARDLGSTSFIVLSAKPPGLEELVESVGEVYTSWICLFANTIVRPLTPVIQFDKYESLGHYFQHDVENLHQKQCFFYDPHLAAYQTGNEFDPGISFTPEGFYNYQHMGPAGFDPSGWGGKSKIFDGYDLCSEWRSDVPASPGDSNIVSYNQEYNIPAGAIGGEPTRYVREEQYLTDMASRGLVGIFGTPTGGSDPYGNAVYYSRQISSFGTTEASPDYYSDNNSRSCGIYLIIKPEYGADLVIETLSVQIKEEIGSSNLEYDASYEAVWEDITSLANNVRQYLIGGVYGIEFEWGNRDFDYSSVVYVKLNVDDSNTNTHFFEYWFKIKDMSYVEYLQQPENSELLDDLLKDESWKYWYEQECKHTDSDELKNLLSECSNQSWYKELLLTNEDFRTWLNNRSGDVTEEFLYELLAWGQEKVWMDHLKSNTVKGVYYYPYPVDCYHTVIRDYQGGCGFEDSDDF